MEYRSDVGLHRIQNSNTPLLRYALFSKLKGDGNFRRRDRGRRTSRIDMRGVLRRRRAADARPRAGKISARKGLRRLLESIVLVSPRPIECRAACSRAVACETRTG